MESLDKAPVTAMKRLSLFREGLQISTPPKEKLVYPRIENSMGIRLVRILPGSSYSNIRCELQLATLGPEVPEYVALSYCWGDAAQKTWILCNGQRLEVTKSLLCALRRFRRKDGIATFWIDQVCIDQENIEERNKQVQLMRDIYRSAQIVYVWLGDEADDSDLAMKFVPRLLQTTQTSGQYSCPCTIEKAGLPQWNAKEWKAVVALLCRPWFGRAWVLQEVATASSTSIVCGREVISWEDYEAFIHRVTETEIWRTLLDGFLEESSSILHRRLVGLLEIKQIYGKDGNLTSGDVLWRSRFFEATDPRDRIYALLGLCNDPLWAPVDYSKNVSDVYRDVAISLIKPLRLGSQNETMPVPNTYPAMSFFSEAERTENRLALPSWVPDWTAKPYKSFWLQIDYLGYKAAGRSKVKISQTEDKNTIAVSGKICDAVHLVSNVAPRTSMTQKQSMKKLSIAWDRQITSLALLSSWILETSSIAASCQRYPDNASREVAYRQTLIGGRAIDNDTFYIPSPESTRKNDYELYYRDFRHALHIICPGGVVNGAPMPQLNLILRQNTAGFRPFFEAFSVVAPGRRFFVSIAGYMGLGPPGMRPGDMLCVFLGGQVPWIIREVDGGYVLVGECYVHGLMNGEAIETQHLPVQDIILK